MADKEKKILYSVETDGLDKTKQGFDKLSESVGNVDSEMSDLKGSSDIVNSSNRDLKKSTDKLSSSQGKMSKGMKKLGKAGKTAFNGMGTALKSMGIGLILSVITLIVDALKKFDPIMDPIKKAFAVVQATVSTIIKNITQVGDILKAVFGGNMDEAKEQWKDLKDNIKEAADAAQRYVDLKIELHKFTTQLLVQNAVLQANADKMNALADDATLSFAKRKAAAQDAADAENELYAANETAAQLAFQTAQAALTAAGGWANASREEQRAFAEAGASYTQAISAREIADVNQKKKRRELIQDEAEQELDYLIDGTRSHLDALLERAANEKIQIGERTDALNEYNDTQKTLAEEQVAILQQFTNKKIDLDKLANESDAKSLSKQAQNLGLSEILTNRLLEVIKERQEVETNTIEAVQTLKDEAAARDAERIAKAKEEAAERIAKSKEEAAEQNAADALKREQLRNAFDMEIEMRKQNSLSQLDILQQELDKKKELLAAEIISKKEFQTEEARVDKISAKIKEESEQAKRDATFMTVAASLNATSQLVYNIGTLMGAEAQAAKFAKGLAILESGVSIVSGFAKTAAIGFPQNIPMLIGYAAQTVGLIAQIKALGNPPEPPKLAEGGIIGGKPHSQGGTTFRGSDGSAFEAERGEYLAIVNKRDASRASMLDSVNSVHGKSFMNNPSSYFAAGGTFNPRQDLKPGDVNDIVRQVVSQVSSIPVTVSERDITKTQRRVTVLERNGNLNNA
jgi:DNA repair exonuclease SbcCD ATPase subunit